MRRWWLPVVVALACGTARAADDDSIGAIQTDLQKIFQAANDHGGSPKAEEFLPLIDRCWKIYDVSAGEDDELDALHEVTMLALYAPGRDPKIADAWRDAMGKIVKDHADDPRLGNIVLQLGAPTGLDQELEGYLSKIRSTTKTPDIKAAFEFKALQEDLNKQSEGQLDDAQTADLVARLKKLAAAYPDAKVPRYGETYASWVKKKVDVIENLKVGKVAPDVAGEDLDGVKFKLSDYRGKVVMLDFWGYW